MKSILFPTDFGDTSRQILHYALNYAEALNAKSTIVHTYQPTMSPRRPIIGEGTYRQQILKKLRDFTTVYIRPPFKNIFFKALEGHPVHKLVEASKSGDFDLIIMGRSNSYNWFMHYFWESKTSLICTKAHCPVLVVPQQAKFDGIQEILAIHEEGENLGFPSDANGSFTEPGQERWVHFIPLSALTFNFPFLQQVSGLFGIGTRSGECTYTKVKTKNPGKPYRPFSDANSAKTPSGAYSGFSLRTPVAVGIRHPDIGCQPAGYKNGDK